MATLQFLRSSSLLHHLKPLHPKLQPPLRRSQLQFPPPSHPPKPITTPLISSVSASSASHTPIPATDRLMSAASYCFPLFNGLQYGRFLLSQHPILAVPFKPLIPVVSRYQSIPFASLISFFSFYMGIVRNRSASRYVRFNALQALVLDVILVVPILAQQILSPGLNLTIWMYNCVFAVLVGSFAYAIGCNVLGKSPHLPYAADTASRQLELMDYY